MPSGPSFHNVCIGLDTHVGMFNQESPIRPSDYSRFIVSLSTNHVLIRALDGCSVVSHALTGEKRVWFTRLSSTLDPQLHLFPSVWFRVCDYLTLAITCGSWALVVESYTIQVWIVWLWRQRSYKDLPLEDSESDEVPCSQYTRPDLETAVEKHKSRLQLHLTQ